MAYESLFTPKKIGSCESKNRICMAPMLMGFANLDGTPTEELMNYYEERAKGGAGILFTEITRVNDFHGAAAFAQLSVSHDRNIEPLRAFADRIHAHGSKLFIQLHHPGRQNIGLLVGMVPLCIAMEKVFGEGFKKLLYKIAPTAGKFMIEHGLTLASVAPSKVEKSYFAESRVRALRKAEIKRLIRQFADGAERAQKAGCDGVMLHATHGYLIQQFLSPYTNRRKDEYGGSFENRMRFLLEILAAIRARCGTFPVVVRLTVDECYGYTGHSERGYSLEEGVKIAKALEEAGADAVDVSSASYDTFNYWLEPTSFRCGWRKHMAKAVKDEIQIPVLAANLIRSPEQAEAQLAEGCQDFIVLGRPHIADPHWAEKVQSGHPEDVRRCICCLYCIESMQNNAYTGGHGCCSVNPLVGLEGQYANGVPQDGGGRRVVVAGGGVAGLTAAEWLNKRGFEVILFEKSDRLGGQILQASNPPLKEKIMWCVEDLETAVRKLGVEIRLNTPATKQTIEELNPYAVIVATGGEPIRPRSIKGIDGANVMLSSEALSDRTALSGKNLVVVGSGMTGLEIAEKFCPDNQVTVIDLAEEIAKGTWMQHKDDILPKLKAHGVNFLLKHKLSEIRPDGVATQNIGDASVHFTPADLVILAMGVRPADALVKELDGRGRVYTVGDAQKSGRIADATRAGFLAALSVK